jgi:SAM-dependent methyltransferase
VGRLPFPTGSVAAIHAGAAIHCWPNPQASACVCCPCTGSPDVTSECPTQVQHHCSSPWCTCFSSEHPAPRLLHLLIPACLTAPQTQPLPHCSLTPQAALAEISRVLAPGGVFVASTFLVPTAPLGQVLGDEVVRPLNQVCMYVCM